MLVYKFFSKYSYLKLLNSIIYFLKRQIIYIVRQKLYCLLIKQILLNNILRAMMLKIKYVSFIEEANSL